MKNMGNRLVSFALSAALLWTLVFPALAAGQPGQAGDSVVILYTNDVHCYIDNNADEGAQTGLTYAKVAALKDCYPNALLLDAGDHIQGTAYGALDHGETILRLMNAAGYDAATLGNHEFDYGMAGCMQAIGWAAFPYLSCNFYHEQDGVAGDPVLDRYQVFDVGDVKIAVVGVTTPETITSSTPAYFQDENGSYIYGIAGGADGSALYAAVQEAIDDASRQADYVIGLGHLGVDPSSGPYTSEQVIAHTAGLDAFIDGHSHTVIECREVADRNGDAVVLTQTGSGLDAVGQMTIAADGTITTRLLTGRDLAGLTPDADVQAIADAWISQTNAALRQVIGRTADTLDNYDAAGDRLVRKQETNTGDFTADALYYLFDSMGLEVDAAIMNGGGIRNPAITGDLSYLTCQQIHPFGNMACLQTVTGQQLPDALEWGAKDADADGLVENGGFLQVSGLKYTINTAIPSTVRQDEKGVWTGGPTGAYRVTDVQVRNRESGAYEPLQLQARYQLAGYSYTLRNLGDGFAMFDGAVNVLDYVMEDYMVLANYIQSFDNGEVTGYAQPAGRITLVNQPAAAYPDDPAAGAWYDQAAAYALDKGYMHSDGRYFAPDAGVSLASVYQALYQREGCPAAAETAVPGTDGQWYHDCLNWAASVGLYESAGEAFTDRMVTRAQAASLLAGYCRHLGIAAPTGDGSMALAVPDYDQIPAQALSGMAFCYYAGLMTGDQNHALQPNRALTRAEFAQLVMNLDRYLAGQPAAA